MLTTTTGYYENVPYDVLLYFMVSGQHHASTIGSTETFEKSRWSVSSVFPLLSKRSFYLCCEGEHGAMWGVGRATHYTRAGRSRTTRT